MRYGQQGTEYPTGVIHLVPMVDQVQMGQRQEAAVQTKAKKHKLTPEAKVKRAAPKAPTFPSAVPKLLQK